MRVPIFRSPRTCVATTSPSSNHGGGAGGFDTSIPGAALPTTGPNCPGNNYGTGILAANPVPHTETVNALRVHFRDWVMKNVEPPESRWPKLADGTLAPANKSDLGFPTIPQLRPTVPEVDFIMPVLDYDWGPDFKPVDGSGVAANAPPPIRRVLPMYAPKVNEDGNELGGVPVALLDAPLGTYVGWNITAGGARPFHQGEICNYVGGMVPFAKTAAERKVNGDPRLSLEERYRDHDGYVAGRTQGDRARSERAIPATPGTRRNLCRTRRRVASCVSANDRFPTFSIGTAPGRKPN
jgi:hypothetical protein